MKTFSKRIKPILNQIEKLHREIEKELNSIEILLVCSKCYRELSKDFISGVISVHPCKCLLDEFTPTDFEKEEHF